MADDLYPAHICQYWSEKERPVCKYYDQKYRVCTYWRVTLEDGTVVTAVPGIGNETKTSDDGDIPIFLLHTALVRASDWPYCNMVGTSTGCNNYKASIEDKTTTDPKTGETTTEPAEDPRCILPDPSRHVTRRGTGRNWVEIISGASYGKLDPRILLVPYPSMTYRRVTAYSVKDDSDKIIPEKEGKCEGIKYAGINGYCTLCNGYSPFHLGTGILEPRPLKAENTADAVKPAVYTNKSMFFVKGDFTTILKEGFNINVILLSDVSVPVKAQIAKSEYIVEDTVITLTEPVVPPDINGAFWGLSTLSELGQRLPFKYEVFNKRAELGRCYWWQGNSIKFTTSIDELMGQICKTPENCKDSGIGVEIGNVKGWNPDDYEACVSGTYNPADPPETDPEDCIEDVDISHQDYIGCLCTDEITKLFYHPDFLGYWALYHQIMPPCNGAKPECPMYTSSICWEYCVDEKMQEGDKIVSEQILELRYYSRKDKWTKKLYEESYPYKGHLFSWEEDSKNSERGVTPQLDYDDSDLFTGHYQIKAKETWIESFDNFYVKQKKVPLTDGVPSNIPRYPGLIKHLDNIRRSPIIRTKFDQFDNKNMLEVTDLFHKYVLIYGEMFFYNSKTYAVNIKDPELKDVFPKELERYDSMLQATTKMTTVDFTKFQEDLDCILEMLLVFAPDKIAMSEYGGDSDFFMINCPSFWDKNKVYVFNKGSGEWEYDTVSFKKIFLGGVIAQTSFKIEGEPSTDGRPMTIDYLPSYESSFMTSENNNGEIEFDFFSFYTAQGGGTEIAYVYNDFVIESGMHAGIPDFSENETEEYEPGKAVNYNNGIDAYTRHIWQNSDAGGEFSYSRFDDICVDGGLYMPWHQSNLIPGSFHTGVASGHSVVHNIPAYPDEKNEAYEGDPSNKLYGERVITESEDGSVSYTGSRYVNSYYNYEVGYRVYKKCIFDGYVYTNKKSHAEDEEFTECDPEVPGTCKGDMVFFGNGGFVLVTVPDEKKELTNYPMPWAIEWMNSSDGENFEAIGVYMYENYEISVPIWVQNPFDANSDDLYPIEMEVVAKGDELQANQMILKPQGIEVYGLEPCSAFIRLKVWVFQKCSFGETPPGSLGDDYEWEEIEDEILTEQNPNIRVCYRSLKPKLNDQGEDTGELDDSYSVPGAGANLTGAVKLTNVLSGEMKSSYKITGFDVDPLLVSVVYKSKFTGRIRGMARTKMITWVRQPYCRDVWINYAWEREMKTYGWNTIEIGDPNDKENYNPNWIIPTDSRCKRNMDDTKWQSYATAYSPLYPYMHYAPVQYDFQHQAYNQSYISRYNDRRFNVGRVHSWGTFDHLYTLYATPYNLAESPLSVRVDPAISCSLFHEDGSVNSYQGHDPNYFQRHPYFTPQIWGSSDVPKHGFYDARMMVPSKKNADRYDYSSTKYLEGKKRKIDTYGYESKGDDPKFIGIGVYVGGISEIEKELYYSNVGAGTAYALQGHDVLYCGYSGYTPMAVYCDRKQYGGRIGFYAKPGDFTADSLSEYPNWFPFHEMRTYPLKFGNVCRDFLSSFRSIDNIYYDKKGRIAAAAYPDVKVRRERMIDPNKTGIFNGEDPLTAVNYKGYVSKLELSKTSKVDYDGKGESPRKDLSGFVGVDVPDYYYRKWVPINYSYSSCDITGSNIDDYPFDLYTKDYKSPFVHPMGLYLADGTIENISVKENIVMVEDDEGNPSDVYDRFRFDQVFAAEELDSTEFARTKGEATSSNVSLIHPAARWNEDDKERSLYWYVYRPYPFIEEDPPEEGENTELEGKPEDWLDGVSSDDDLEAESRIAIQWVWREHWRDLERQHIDLPNLQTCTEETNADKEKDGIDPSDFELRFEDPFTENTDKPGTATGRFLFLDISCPSYQMDGQLYEHRLVCDEGVDNETSIRGSHKIKFLPPPKDEDGRYKHHVFFLQLDGGPPRGFTIGTDPLDPNTGVVGSWDPLQMDDSYNDFDDGLEIPGWDGDTWDELDSQNVFELYQTCSYDDTWFKITCPKCDGIGRYKGEECPGCAGEKEVHPVTLYHTDYIDMDYSAAVTLGRSIKRYDIDITGTEDLAYQRGLYVDLLSEMFDFLPKSTKMVDKELYEVCFARGSVDEGPETTLPDVVMGEYAEPGEFIAAGTRYYNAIYTCSRPGAVSGYAEIIFNFQEGKSIVNNTGKEETPQLRTITKVIMEFEIGTKKEADKKVLYHEPAISILAGETGEKVYSLYSEEMTLTKKPGPGKAVGVTSVKTCICEWENDPDSIFDPQKYARIEMRINPTSEELADQGLNDDYYDNDVINKVKLLYVYLFSVEYIKAEESIMSYERKYHISVGEYGDIVPDTFSPDPDELGEMTHNVRSNIGKWNHEDGNYKFGLYPNDSKGYNRVSCVYEQDSPAGVIGHEGSSGDLAYMTKCRGRVCSVATANGSSLSTIEEDGGGLSGDGTNERFDPGSLDPTEGSVSEVQDWEKLQEKNYNKVTGHAEGDSINEAGSTTFTMKSVCPPGLNSYLKEMGISDFPVWDLVFTNTFVPPLTPTIQHQPWNHDGRAVVWHANVMHNNPQRQYISQIRNLFYEANDKLSPYHDWDYETENREMLRLQKTYFYNTIVPQYYNETTYNYPYPVDAFVTVMRDAPEQTVGYGCPAPELGENWWWIRQYNKHWLGPNHSNNQTNLAQDFTDTHVYTNYDPGVSRDRLYDEDYRTPFYYGTEDFRGSTLYETRLVVDKRSKGLSSQGSTYIKLKANSENRSSSIYFPSWLEPYIAV